VFCRSFHLTVDFFASLINKRRASAGFPFSFFFSGWGQHAIPPLPPQARSVAIGHRPPRRFFSFPPRTRLILFSPFFHSPYGPRAIALFCFFFPGVWLLQSPGRRNLRLSPPPSLLQQKNCKNRASFFSPFLHVFQRFRPITTFTKHPPFFFELGPPPSAAWPFSFFPRVLPPPGSRRTQRTTDTSLFFASWPGNWADLSSFPPRPPSGLFFTGGERESFSYEEYQNYRALPPPFFPFLG